jgi:hypothetical protein
MDLLIQNRINKQLLVETQLQFLFVIGTVFNLYLDMLLDSFFNLTMDNPCDVP